MGMQNIFRLIKIKETLSIGLIATFLLLEKPSIFYRFSIIETTDSKKLFIVAFVAFIWLTALAAIFFAARSRPVFKWGFFLLATISLFIFDVFTATSHNGYATLLYGDYITIRQSAANLNDVLAEYGNLLIAPFFRMFLLFLAFFISTPDLIKKAEVKSSLLIILCLAIFVGICVTKKGTGTDKIPGFLSIYGFEIAMLLDEKNPAYNYGNIFFKPRTQPRRENILLIIDESVRSDFFNGAEAISGLNIKSNSLWNVYDYGSATSGNNCSHYTSIILRKGPKPDHLRAEIQENPLIWAYAKEAGFRTTLIDAQHSGQGHDYFDLVELKMIDNNVNTEKYQSDKDIAVELKKLLKNGNNFVIIVKKGAHFPYVERYPTTFGPNFNSAYINEKQNRIEYARAIMYQTGGFFAELLGESLTPSTLMVYTSDHGQNLNDTSGPTHCTTTGDPYQGEGMVPMLVIDNRQDEKLSSFSQINHNKTSHFNVFSTLLYYLGYEKNDYQSHYGDSLIEPVKRLGYFNYGRPFGYFGSEPMFKRTGEALDYSGDKKIISP